VTEKDLSQFGHNAVKVRPVVKTVTTSFNAIKRQMTEMFQRKTKPVIFYQYQFI